MSLSIYLTQKYQITYDEGKTFIDKEETLFDTNITHNLTTMADKAGIYYALWRPEEIQKEKASGIVPQTTETQFKCDFPGCGFVTNKNIALLGHKRGHRNEVEIESKKQEAVSNISQ